MSRRTIALALVLAACLLLAALAYLLVRAALGSSGLNLGQMISLQQAVRRQFPGGDVSISVQNRTDLIVTLTNSPYNALTPAAQSGKARDIAAFVENAYAGIAAVQAIHIVFVDQRRSGLFTTHQASASYPFPLPLAYP